MPYFSLTSIQLLLCDYNPVICYSKFIFLVSAEMVLGGAFPVNQIQNSS
jgi:hypothetical protein